VVEDVDEVRTADAGAAGAAAHRQLVAKRVRGRLAHARHAEILAQHRRQLDVEVVERDDPVDLLGAADTGEALADVLGGHVAAEVVELVHGLARPVGIAELLLGEEQHAAALPAALAQEFVAFSVGCDAEDRQRHGTPFYVLPRWSRERSCSRPPMQDTRQDQGSTRAGGASGIRARSGRGLEAPRAGNDLPMSLEADRTAGIRPFWGEGAGE
jgi:hypothetical protein